MKLLFISESFPTSSDADFTGGVEARDYYTALHLSRNHHVTVITNARPGVPRSQKIHSIHIIRSGLPTNSKFRNNPVSRIIFFFTALATGLRQHPDLIQSSNVFTAPIGFILSRLKHRPGVLVVHDVFIGSWFSLTDPITALIGEVLERLVLKLKFDLIIANSRATAAKLNQYHHFNHNNLTVIPGGVDRQTCRQLKAVKTSHPQLVYAGRLVSYKRVPDLIHAHSRLLPQYPHLQLIIIGDGPQAPKLKKLVKSLQLNSSVTFLGFIPNHLDVLKHIKSSTLFCLPSAVEGFGLVTLEALALGVPYVSTRIPATLELTNSGQGGLLYPPGHIARLKGSIHRLLSNPSLYHTKQRQGHKLASRYDWAIISQITAKKFTQLTNSSA